MLAKTNVIAVIPTSDYYLNNNMFSSDFNLDNRLQGYIDLKSSLEKENWIINTIDKYEDYNKIDVVLFERIDYYYLRLFILKYPMARRVLVPWEPEVVSRGHSVKKLMKLASYFDYILTWNDDLVDNKKFYKINYAHHLEPTYSNIPRVKEFTAKKLLVQVSSNLTSNHPFELYSLRKKLNYLSEKRYGNGYAYFGSGWKTNSQSYKGIAQDKRKTISQFKFSFCLENMRTVNGYITEKIFDCFVAGVVPIYFGASNLTHYIPKKCFVDFRDFEDPNELFDHLDSMDYEEWRQYLIEAKEFLARSAQPFSNDYFIDKIFDVIVKDFNREKSSDLSIVMITLKSILQLQRKRLSYIKRLIVNNSKKLL